LLERQLALKNIPFRQSKFAFEIERRQNLSMQNNVFDIRRVLSDRIDDCIAKLFALVIPVSFFQVVRGVLYEA